MKIQNIEGMSAAQIREGIANGGKFVFYKYCISIIVMTFNRPSDIYYIAPGKSAVVPGLSWFFINLILGWWGIPWGPIYTLGNLFSTLSGGKDVTSEVMASINQSDPQYGAESVYNVGGVTSYGTNHDANPYQINTPDNETYRVGGQNNNQQNDTYNIR